MWSTKQYFINRDPVLSFSISVKNFTETRSPYHAGGNSTIPFPRIFKVRVKMYMTSHRTFAWDCSCSFNPKKKRIFPLIRFPLILSKPFSSERNGPRIQVPHVGKTPENPISVKSRYIGCLATILIRGKWAPDSITPYPSTPDTIETYHN